MLRVALSSALLVCLALLSGCGTPSPATSPTISAPQPSPKRPTAEAQRSATPSSAAPTAAAASPAVSPTSAPALARAAELPLDQPWVWADGALTAVGADRQFTTLVQPVLVTIERAGLPPLLITRADDHSLALVDPEGWTSHNLSLPAGTMVSGPFAWSPDRTEVAAIVFADAPATAAKTGYQLYRIDVQRGAARLVLDQLGGDAVYDPPEPVAWGPDALLVRVQSSATSVFWRVDLAHEPAAAHQVLTIGETGGWSVDERAGLLAHRYFGQAPLVRNLTAGVERPIAGSTPAVAPDGTRIAYLTPSSSRSSGCCTLHIEPADGRDALAVSLSSASSDAIQLAWTSDGTRLLAVESGSAFTQAGGVQIIGHGQLWVLRSDGTLVGSIALRNAESLRLTPDDQVLVVERGEPFILEQFDLRASATRALATELALASTASAPWVVYAPPAADRMASLPAGAAASMPLAPLPTSPSPVDGAESLQQYPADAFGVAFTFPASWRKSSRSMDRYDGDIGFVTVGAGLNGGVWTIQSACEHEASHKLHPYGTTPQLEYVTVDHQLACLIWPSADQDPGFEAMAELIVLAPHPIIVADTSYDFLILSADKRYLRVIAQTVQFRL